MSSYNTKVFLRPHKLKQRVIVMSNPGVVVNQAPPSEAAVEGELKVSETAVEAAPEVVAKVEEKPKRERKLKVVKEKKEKKAKAPSHPPYFQMIKEAITALNEKGGSSPYAIAKYMEQNHKSVLPSNFRKILGLQLKNSVSKGKLFKIKASYKLTEAAKKREKQPPPPATRAARANAAKEPAKKRKRTKSKVVSKIDSLPVSPPTARRSKRSAPAKKVKTIKPPVAKKAKKGTA